MAPDLFEKNHVKMIVKHVKKEISVSMSSSSNQIIQEWLGHFFGGAEGELSEWGEGVTGNSTSVFNVDDDRCSLN